LRKLSLNHLVAALRRTSLLDRLALGIVLLYILGRVVVAFGRYLPFSPILTFFTFLAVVYLFIRLLPWFRNQFMWRLRNRLIVVYLFIAVFPLLLLLTMAGIAAYGICLQLGAHLLHDDIQERVVALSAESDALAGAIEMEASKSTVPVDESTLGKSSVADVVLAAKQTFPGLRILVNHGEHLLKTANARHFAGLAEWNGKLWLASASRRESAGNGPFTVLLAEPVNPAFLDEFPSELGPIQFIFLRPVSQRPTNGIVFDFKSQLYVPGEQILSRRRALTPAAYWFDWRVNGYSTIELASMDSSDDSRPAVLASFSVRPSALLQRLFTSVGEMGPLLQAVLIASAVIFLLLEIGAFVTGVVLTRTITSAVADLYDATTHIRQADFTHRVRVRRHDQLGALGESFNEMTSSISELIAEQRQLQRLENEVAIAREVQSQLFPQSLPTLPGLQLGAICRPARVVSGDYYDFIRLSASKVGIALADISGKGIFAALLMASLQAALRSTACFDGRTGTASLVSHLNDHLFRNTSDDRYATFFYAVYDCDSRTLTYTNAGHLAPFFVFDGRMQQLDEGGTVVGLIPESTYTQGVIQVAPGSMLVAFSDGLTEPENVYGEEFGTQRLKDEVLRQTNLPPDRLAANLIAAAEQWAGTAEQADDMTVVIARMG
jgi:phosphoserine phosphatase RsbU/P